MNRLNIPGKIRRFLREVQLPGRYLGRERNAVHKDLSAVRYRIALCYPDTYEIGMSHLGLAILYHLANDPDDQYAERCFAPWPDMAQAMRDRDIPLFSLETATPLNAFDLVGFSLQHELLYANVLYMLDLAGIPLRSADRTSSDPLIVAGGSGALTPEPMAEAIDIFLPGDGEVTLPILISVLKDLKARGVPRPVMLKQAARLCPHAYIPALYRPRYDAGGRYRGLDPLYENIPIRVEQGLLEDLEASPIPLAPIQPLIRCVHERITLEIMRGCTRGCRFCQAGMTRRPLRMRSSDTVFNAARAIYACTGYDEISLCSLSTADYPDLDRLVHRLNDHFEPLRVGISLPSLRVDKKLSKLTGPTSTVRKAGLTLAPEAASEKLRLQVNKQITDQDLEEAALSAYEEGWRRVKLYFMIGLPGETEDDVKAIADLSRKISGLRSRLGKGPAHVTVSVSTFVPKAHTPFQWSAMNRPETVRAKQRILRSMKVPKQIRFNFHDVKMSFVEAMLSRGDRSLFNAVEKAFHGGACFDAWKDRFRFNIWEQAFQETGADAEKILFSDRAESDVFPWDHIVTGPSRSFLRTEFDRSCKGETTAYCEGPVCHQCGVDPLHCAALKKKRKGHEE